MIVLHQRTKQVIAHNVVKAESMGLRIKGLMFSKDLKQGHGLLLNPCNSIHTFFMNYSIDVIFISSKNSVIKILRGLKPWKLTWIYFKAVKTLELPGGSIPLDVVEGDQLEFQDV
jgi:uncharacterized membrane protein (UPF0127 family)